MRKLIIGVLLAGFAVTPAMADDDDDDDGARQWRRHQWQAERGGDRGRWERRHDSRRAWAVQRRYDRAKWREARRFAHVEHFARYATSRRFVEVHQPAPYEPVVRFMAPIERYDEPVRFAPRLSAYDDLAGLGGVTQAPALGGLLSGGSLLGGLLPAVLGGQTGFGSPAVLPINSLSYGYAAPYDAGLGGGDLSSLLLPALLGQNGF